MEGLYTNYDSEDGPEKDKDQDKPEIKDKDRKVAKAEKTEIKDSSFFDELIGNTETKEPKEPKESQSELSKILEEDRAPELDAEAPYNHLGEVERDAITQAVAADRLEVVQETESPIVSAETIGAVSFLENVQANPDMELAKEQTLTEMGVTEEESADATPVQESVEVETAEPIDPDSLRTAARQELQVAIAEPGPQAEAFDLSTLPRSSKTSSKEEHPKSKRDKRLQGGLVDYVVGRRVGE